MAVAAGAVQIAQGEDGEVVAIQRQVVVDPEGGVAQVDRVLVAVPDEQGNVAVAEHIRVQAVEINDPVMISLASYTL